MVIVCGIVGMLLGVFIAAQLDLAESGISKLPFLSYARLRPLITNAVIFLRYGGFWR